LRERTAWPSGSASGSGGSSRWADRKAGLTRFQAAVRAGQGRPPKPAAAVNQSSSASLSPRLVSGARSLRAAPHAGRTGISSHRPRVRITDWIHRGDHCFIKLSRATRTAGTFRSLAAMAIPSRASASDVLDGTVSKRITFTQYAFATSTKGMARRVLQPIPDKRRSRCMAALDHCRWVDRVG
jgi:hypothetical protein